MKNSFALCRLYRCEDGTNISLVVIQQVHGGHTIHSTELWPDLQREICWRATEHRQAFDLGVCLPVGHCCVRNASAVRGEREWDKGEFQSLLDAEPQLLQNVLWLQHQLDGHTPLYSSTHHSEE